MDFTADREGREEKVGWRSIWANWKCHGLLNLGREPEELSSPPLSRPANTSILIFSRLPSLPPLQMFGPAPCQDTSTLHFQWGNPEMWLNYSGSMFLFIIFFTYQISSEISDLKKHFQILLQYIYICLLTNFYYILLAKKRERKSCFQNKNKLEIKAAFSFTIHPWASLLPEHNSLQNLINRTSVMMWID